MWPHLSIVLFILTSWIWLQSKTWQQFFGHILAINRFKCIAQWVGLGSWKMITFACYSYLHSTYLLTKDFTNMTAVNIEMLQRQKNVTLPANKLILNLGPIQSYSLWRYNKWKVERELDEGGIIEQKETRDQQGCVVWGGQIEPETWEPLS